MGVGPNHVTLAKRARLSKYNFCVFCTAGRKIHRVSDNFKGRLRVALLLSVSPLLEAVYLG